MLQDTVYKIPHWAANEQLPKALAGSLGYHQGSAEALVDNVVIALEGALDPAIVWAAAKALLRRKDAPGHPFFETDCTCRGGPSPLRGS
jgi:hypothetical protein